MNTRHFMRAAGFFVLGLIATACFPDRAIGQETRDAQQDAKDSVDVRYARMNLKLAELELKIALDANKKSANYYSSAAVKRLENNVALASKQLALQRQENGVELHDIHLREVEGAVQIAELNLRNAASINKRMPGLFSDQEIERLRLTAELARLALARARDPSAVKSHESHVQWQLDQLRAAVLRLQIRLDRRSQ